MGYKKLEKIFHEISLLESVAAILDWDKETMMPKGAISERAMQLSLISGLLHNKIISSEVQELIKSTNADHLDEWEAANLREIKKQVKNNTCFSTEFIQKFSEASINCCDKWKEAKKAKDFNIVKNHLAEVIDLTKHMAEIRSQTFQMKPYDSLMDLYNPNSTVKEIDAIFNDLKVFLLDIIPNIKNKDCGNIDRRTYPIEIQEKLNHFVLSSLGFDKKRGRIDTSAHPFCVDGKMDIRMTTMYKESDFTNSLYSTIHETGHGIYNQNKPKKYLYQPVGAALGYAVHESQSLFFENKIAKTIEFCQFLMPKIREIFGRYADGILPEHLYNHVTKVQNSLIRVDADEVTYPLHIIIRYELEKLLLSGEIRVNDLPHIWNKYYEKYLDITPSNDSEGVMQDIHWYQGSFGYFPSYTIGEVINSQLYYQVNEVYNVKEFIRNGNFSPIVSWLNTNIHNKGSFFQSANELVKSIRNEDISVSYFKKYLSEKFL